MANTGDGFMDAILLLWDIVRYGWIFFVIIWLVICKIRWKKYPIEAIIIEKRGSNLIKTNDRCGKYVDKYTNITGYRLQKSKDTMPVINFEWMLHSNTVPTNIFEKLVSLLRPTAGTILFFRYGTKQYKPIEVMEKGKLKKGYRELKDKEGKSIIQNLYEQLDPRDKLKMLNFEVVDWDNMNFMVQEQRASAERRKKSSDFWKQILIPGMIIAGAVIFAIVAMKFGYDRSVAFTPATENEIATSPNIPIISDVIPG